MERFSKSSVFRIFSIDFQKRHELFSQLKTKNLNLYDLSSIIRSTIFTINVFFLSIKRRLWQIIFFNWLAGIRGWLNLIDIFFKKHGILFNKNFFIFLCFSNRLRNNFIVRPPDIDFNNCIINKRGIIIAERYEDCLFVHDIWSKS